MKAHVCPHCGEFLCPRCGTEMKGLARTLSYFNTDEICPDCDDAERAHPDFAYALEREEQAVVSGNHNYPGVGWPGTDGRIQREEN